MEHLTCAIINYLGSYRCIIKVIDQTTAERRVCCGQGSGTLQSRDGR